VKPWFVYILRCADDTLYTRITTDVARRVQEHSAGAALAAGRREAAIRKPDRSRKLALCGEAIRPPA
jgi:putative endonuclease